MTGRVGPAPPSADVVGVFDQNFNQVFISARPVRASIKQGGKLAKHPVETGGTITDNRITLPVEIDLSMVLTPREYRDTFQEILANYRALTPLFVQTKVASFDNMFIESLPHEETPDFYDTIALALKLTQVIFVKAQYAQLTAVKDPSNSSTAKSGQKEGAEASPAQTSAAYDLFFGGKP